MAVKFNYCFLCLSSLKEFERGKPGRKRKSRVKFENEEKRNERAVKNLLNYLIPLGEQQPQQGKPLNDSNSSRSGDKFMELFIPGGKKSGNGNNLFKICSNCKNVAGKLLDLHLQLETLQMKIVNEVKEVRENILRSFEFLGSWNDYDNFDKVETFRTKFPHLFCEGSGLSPENADFIMNNLREFRTAVDKQDRKSIYYPLIYLEKFGISQINLEESIQPKIGTFDDFLPNQYAGQIKTETDVVEVDLGHGQDVDELSFSMINHDLDHDLNYIPPSDDEEMEMLKKPDGFERYNPASSVQSLTVPVQESKKSCLGRTPKTGKSKTKTESFKAEYQEPSFAIIPCDAKDATNSSTSDSTYWKNPDTGTYKCLTCFKDFDRQMNFQHHYFKVHPKQLYKCLLCGQTYKVESHYKLHHRTKHLGLKVKCQFCQGEFENTYHLLKHRRNSNCGKVIEEQRKQVGHGKRDCEICGKTFSSGAAFRVHFKMVHQKVRDNSCDQCGKLFSSKPSLYLHQRRFHSKEEDKVPCHQCGREFGNKAYLNKHMKEVHLAQYDQTCEHCGKSYKEKRKLTRHINKFHPEIQKCNFYIKSY